MFLSFRKIIYLLAKSLYFFHLIDKNIRCVIIQNMDYLFKLLDKYFNLYGNKRGAIVDKLILGRRIREQRERQNLNQEQFAEIVDISNVHLSEIERGRKSPSMETFIRIVNALDTPADYLLRYEVKTARHVILNEITEKMKDLPPEQIEFINDLFNAAMKNFPNFGSKTVE
jgi:transcriptional regulator with XRE-family HTH domain